ncbi:hypothetical protein FRB98_008207 [Tulasnella sp. 332]|nr:hypothetical protein FRB98_008207 [Tulasnella sp. 332]
MGPLPTRGPNTPPDDLARICDLSIDYPDHVVEETIVWLKRFVTDLSSGFMDERDDYDHEPDEIVLAERGLSEASELTENERNPIRLEEAVEPLRYVVNAWRSDGHNVPLTEDPRYDGTHDQEIVELLRGLGLDKPNPDPQSNSQASLRGRIDELNTILGKSTLARVLRRMGEVSEAAQIEDNTAAFIRSRLAISVPSTIRANILGKDEHPTSSPILNLLGPNYFDRYVEHPYVAGKGWYMDVRDLPGKPPGTVSKLLLPSDSNSSALGTGRKDPPVTLIPPCEVDKSERGECWVSGCRVTQNLKLCQCE